MLRVEPLKSLISKIIAADSRWRIVTAEPTLVRAIPAELEEVLPSIGNLSGVSDSAWLTLHFWIDSRPKPRLGVFWRSTSVRDRESRNRVLNALLESGGTGFAYRGAKNAWSKNDDPAFSGKTVSKEWWPAGKAPDLLAAREDIRNQLKSWNKRLPNILRALTNSPRAILSKTRLSATRNDETLEYLNHTLRRGDVTAFLVALRERARSLGMSRVAESGQLNRENLYRMLSPDGNPTFSNLLNVLTALGLRLEVNRRGAKLAAFSDADERLNDTVQDNSSEPTKHSKSGSLKRRPIATALQPTLAKRLKHCAREQGISFETLVNLWLSEKLIEASK